MDFQVLGAVEAHSANRTVDLGHARQKAALAILLAEAGTTVTVDKLIDRLWGGRAPRSARETLYGYVSRLRSALAGEVAVVRQSGGYRLEVEPMHVDMHRFERLVAAARAESVLERACELWDEALQLWRGEPFAGLDVPWLREIAANLGHRRFAAQLEHNDVRLALGRHAPLTPHLEALLEEHPLDERLNGQLMSALHHCGRQAEALACYARLRRRLVDELGSDPGPPLQRLHRQILDAGAATSPHGDALAAAAQPSSWARGYAALDVPDFVGRDAHLAEIDAAVAADATSAIVALSGTGGVGKSALAVHWARRSQTRDRFPDGCLFVDLQGYSGQSPTAAHDALAQLLRQLGVAGSQIPHDVDDAEAMYRDRLSGRRFLVILDNAFDAAQVRRLLAESTCLTLITSRDKLSGLSARDAVLRIPLDRMSDADAHRLAGKLLGRVDSDSDAVARLVEVCARLPLAIRVAAADFAARPGVKLHAYVDQLADDRLGVLDAGGDDTTAVAAVLSWSVNRLRPELTRVFCLLGTHPGPRLDVESAAAMAAVSVDTARGVLRELVAASLLDEVGPGRFAMHDLLREYAREHADAIGIDDQVTQRRLLEDLWRRLGQDPVDKDWIRREHPSLIACLQLSCDASALGRYALRLGDLLHVLNEYSDAQHAYIVARRVLPADTAAHGLATRGLGCAARFTGQTETAMDYLDQALEALRRLGDGPEQALTLRELARVHGDQGKHRSRAQLCRQALQLSRRHHDREGETGALVGLATASISVADDAAAADFADQALTLARELGNRGQEAAALLVLADTTFNAADVAGAAAGYAATLAAYRDVQDRRGEATALCRTGRMAITYGRAEDAIDSYQAALQLCVETGDRLQTTQTLHGLGNAELCAGRFADSVARFTQALSLARSLGQRVGEAFVRNDMAMALRADGDCQAAAREHLRALEIFVEIDNPRGQGMAHYGLGCVAAAGDDHEEAQRRWDAARRIFERLASPLADKVRHTQQAPKGQALSCIPLTCR